MYIGYYESGEFLNKLAERIISAQRQLAEDGHRVGGNAPCGFGRVLVDASGQVLQELPKGLDGSPARLPRPDRAER